MTAAVFRLPRAALTEMSRNRVAIIDSGGANIASVMFALERLGVRPVLTDDPGTIRDASHVILPGVGAAAVAMERLRQKQLHELIPGLVQPVLGICLGMQLLAESSAEGDAVCLGVLPVTARKLKGTPQNPVPHMGWSPIRFSASHPILDGIGSGTYFYFVHSYALPPGSFAVATAVHDVELTAVLVHANFYATQFHPERSSAAGSRVLQNFLSL
jgi:imidazole glycerol-phosphate synthase subunit HisH